MQKSLEYNSKEVNMICICSCEATENGGGLYTYKISDGGKLENVSLLPEDCPMYAVYRNKKLYVIAREVFDGKSAVFDVNVSKGCFGEKGDYCSTNGKVACHLTVLDDCVYAVNYVSGSVIKLPDTMVFDEGRGVNVERQEAPHPHCVIPSPDERYILVADLGLDKIKVMTRNLEPISQASVEKGHGARHLVFSSDGRYLYCVNELMATVSVFLWEGEVGELKYTATFDSAVPKAVLPHNTASAIRISNDGERLYISNRGEDTIVVFDVKDGTRLELAQKVSCGGNHPRDFILTDDERYLVCTNMETNEAVVFSLNNGYIEKETDRVSLPKPLCVTNI